MIVSWLLIECVSCLMFSGSMFYVQCSMFVAYTYLFYNKNEIVFVRIFGAFSSLLFCSVLLYNNGRFFYCTGRSIDRSMNKRLIG